MRIILNINCIYLVSLIRCMEKFIGLKDILNWDTFPLHFPEILDTKKSKYVDSN